MVLSPATSKHLPLCLFCTSIGPLSPVKWSRQYWFVGAQPDGTLQIWATVPAPVQADWTAAAPSFWLKNFVPRNASVYSLSRHFPLCLTVSVWSSPPLYAFAIGDTTAATERPTTKVATTATNEYLRMTFTPSCGTR